MGILRADISESGLQSDTVQHPGLALMLPRFYIYEDLLSSGQNPARGPAFYLGEKSPGCSQHQELCQEQQQGYQEGAGPQKPTALGSLCSHLPLLQNFGYGAHTRGSPDTSHKQKVSRKGFVQQDI